MFMPYTEVTIFKMRIKTMDLNELFRQLYEELKNGNYSQGEKMAIIKNVGEMYRNQLDDELTKELTKQYTGAALEIGSAAIPVGGLAGQIAKRTIPAAVTKTLGRKISQDIATSAIGGAIDSSVFGAGRGLVEGGNPFQTATQDALTGAIIGGALGGVTGAAQKSISGKRLQSLDDSEIFGANYQQSRKLGEEYYKNYNQDKVITHNDIGGITFGRKGMKESINKNPASVREFPDLIKNVKNADYLETNDLYKVKKDKNIKDFHTLSDNEHEYLIARDKKNNQKFYLTIKRTADQGIPPIEDTNFSPSTTGGASSGSSLGIKSHKDLKPVSILDDFVQNINLPERVNPSATVGIQSAIDNFVKSDVNISQQNANNEKFGVQKPFELRIEKRRMPTGEVVDIETPTGYAAPTKGFRQSVDLTGWKNPINGDNRIYTAEDIGEMSHKEFGKLERIIDAQMNSIGIPRKKDLGLFSGGSIYIAPYTRADGIKVRGHYRALRY